MKIKAGYNTMPSVAYIYILLNFYNILFSVPAFFYAGQSYPSRIVYPFRSV